jgi:DNA modification methylase
MNTQLNFTQTSTQTMHLGDCIDIMRTMPDNSIDFICTDPPYGLHFMGKKWDSFKYKKTEGWNFQGQPRNIGFAQTASACDAGTYDDRRNDEFQEFIKQFGIEALRILKPGSHIAIFGAPRRHHRQMSGLEDAGFEIRDVIMWITGQSFPKSHNFGCRCKGLPLQNRRGQTCETCKGIIGFEGYGTGLKGSYEPIILAMKPLDGTYKNNGEKWGVGGLNIDASKIGDRWPASTIFDESAAELLDQQTDNASRFFYCPKASSSERNKGLDKPCSHPTVKPIAIMKYIIKLLAPPGAPTLLDPFAGSGTTLLAAKQLDINAIGIEKEEEYYNIAKARINNG